MHALMLTPTHPPANPAHTPSRPCLLLVWSCKCADGVLTRHGANFHCDLRPLVGHQLLQDAPLVGADERHVVALAPPLQPPRDPVVVHLLPYRNAQQKTPLVSNASSTMPMAQQGRDCRLRKRQALHEHVAHRTPFASPLTGMYNGG